ncbi:MAG: carbon monoxide dehydrogenase [Acidobacteria bacterium]|nr:MAG: carbon monoxide dehydrogenase [Acidobacteriota bacterium]
MGRAVPRKEGRSKVTGQALYLDDVRADGMLYGATVRSPVSRGRIRSIEFDPSIEWGKFTVVTAKDIPGRNVVALIVDDQPYLAADAVNHAEEPVVLLAHPDPAKLEDARRKVTIVVDPLPAVSSIDDALSGREVVWGTDNLFKSYTVARGDVEAAFAGAPIVVEGEYETGSQEQLYIEPNGMLAIADLQNGVTVWGSMQCPYYVHRALAGLFNLPAEKIRVVQMETGGGFGGKEEYPSIIAGHAALLAWKSGRPVKIVYSRAEDMVATTKRHPSRTKHRTAVTRDGRLLAMDVDFVIDGGAYCTLSPVVLSRGTIHAAGPYRCDHVRIRGRAVATNVPPHGAFRGFGAPQSIFALERHMDRVAAAVGLGPDEFRRRNFVHAGDTLAVGQVIREPVSMNTLLDRALALAGYHDKRRRFVEENGTRAIKKGIGFSTFMHGAGFTGSGEDRLASVVAVEATREGVVRVLAASTEIGQGTNTIFSQIAAEALGIDPDDVEVVQPDTSEVPNSGPTVVLPSVHSRAEFRAACRRYVDSYGTLRATSRYQPPPGVRWDDQTYQGDAYGTYAWAAYVAEVSVDTTTYEIRVDDFVAVQEVGKVINPTLAMGQIEGGVAQGVGWALYEDVVWREGRMANAQMTNYIMPTSMDLPEIRVHFEEVPYPYGPAGAKGIGELPMDGPAPAIFNAVEHATGISATRLPLTPERLMELMCASPAV